MQPAPLTALLDLMERYIWKLAHNYASTTPGQEPADFFQEGVITLMRVYQAHGTKPQDELVKIFKTSLVHQFISIYRQHVSSKQTVTLDLEAVTSTMSEDAFNDLYMQHYTEHLQSVVSPDAARLLAQLLDPDPALVRMHSITMTRRQHLRAQGIPTCVAKKITHQLAGHYLGFSLSRTKRLIAELQRAWKEMQCYPTSPVQSAAMC